MLIGSFTWEQGATPDEVKDFVADVGYKPENVYVFGTGDTQFGGDALFCNAAVKLARFYASAYEPLKIEQSPRGVQQEKVIEWSKGSHQTLEKLTRVKVLEPAHPNKSTAIFGGKASGILNWNDIAHPHFYTLRQQDPFTFLDGQ